MKTTRILALTMLWLSSATNIFGQTTENQILCPADSADIWVQNNIAEIHKMDRDEWIKINDEAKRKAAFNAFSAKQKQDFWLNKLNEVLTLDWNNDEKSHILALASFIRENGSVFAATQEEEATKSFLEKWIKDGEERFGWSKHTLYAIIATGEKMADRQGRLVSSKQNE